MSEPDNTLILPIVKYGSSLLRKKVSPVIDFTTLAPLIEKMFHSMNNENGIDLAANQLGWSLDIMIVDTLDCENEEDPGTYVFINSTIIDTDGICAMEEGCLSIPNIRAEIKRPEKIILKYQDLEENYHEKSFSGITSRVIQHEMDHLNGKLFIDYLPQSKRMLIKKRLMEISKTRKTSDAIIL